MGRMYETKGLARHHKERTSSGHARAGRSLRPRKRPYVQGECILFQDYPGARWEPGKYVSADLSPGARGWHTIQDDRGFGEKHFVPGRRIKAVVPEV